MAIEVELDIKEAVSRLRRLCSEFGTRHSRIHKGAALDNVHRLRAIDGGICGQCPNVRLEASRRFDKPSVKVGCYRRYSPLEMYRRTALGEIPECPGFDE